MFFKHAFIKKLYFLAKNCPKTFERVFIIVLEPKGGNISTTVGK